MKLSPFFTNVASCALSAASIGRFQMLTPSFSPWSEGRCQAQRVPSSSLFGACVAALRPQRPSVTRARWSSLALTTGHSPEPPALGPLPCPSFQTLPSALGPPSEFMAWSCLSDNSDHHDPPSRELGFCLTALWAVLTTHPINPGLSVSPVVDTSPWGAHTA